MKNQILFFFLFIVSSPILAQDTLLAPQNLQAEVFANNVTLNWLSPQSDSDYISWENGFISNSIGLTGAGTYSVAAKWEPQQIPDFIGEKIEKVSIHTVGENSTYTLKIWKGINAESLVLSQLIDNIVHNQWFDVYLDSTITIDPEIPVWVGYEVDQTDTDYPASIDSGPAVEGYGDLIFWDNSWTTLSAFGLSNNWSIRAYTSGSGNQMAMLPAMKPVQNTNTNPATDYPFILNPVPYNPESISELQGFNIYVDGDQINEQLVNLNSYYAGIFQEGNYVFGVTSVYDEGESEPAEISVEIGGGFLMFDPTQLDVDIPSGEISEVPVALTNPGSSTINWLAIEYQSWLSLSSTEGSVETGSTDEISFIIDAGNLEPGYYYANVVFSFNNVILPQSYYYISVFVEGDPEILIEPENLNFGNVETGSSKTLSFQMQNEGFATVTIDSITSGSTAFMVNNQGFELNPWGHTFVPVIFTPDSLNPYESEIYIHTDFSSEPLIVNVTGTGTLAAPTFFNAQLINNNDAELSWLPPNGIEGTTLHWDNGENETGIGYGVEGIFSYGAKWTPEFLENVNGLTALGVSFFPFAEESTFTLKIYEGDNAANLIVSQPINDYNPYEWNNVTINTPFEIDGSQELWVTFEVNNAWDEYPCGADSGPAFAGFGDLISEDGVNWVSISQTYGLSNNWNIQLFAGDQVTANNPVAIPRSTVPREILGTLQVATGIQNKKQTITHNNQQNASLSSFELLGYNVYRDNEKINDQLVTSLNFLDPDLENGIYEYGVNAVYDMGESPRVTDVVQIGAPEIAFTPESLTIELGSGEIVTDTITISNSGNVELLWEASSNTSFVIPEATAGSVLPGENQQLPITVDATYIGGGTINTAIQLTINNLNNPQTSYPVIVVVTGSPDLYVFNQQLDFGNVTPGTTTTRTVEVINFGFGNADVFDLEIIGDVPFYVNDSVYTVSSQEVLQIPVQFTPTEVETFTGTLTFSTSDPDLSTVSIPLSGNGYLKPPLVLNASANENNVELSWLPPDGGEGNYLQYDNGENFQSVGLSGGGTFAVAAKWQPDELISKVGKFVSAVGFYPTSETTTYTIMIWKGSNADSVLVQQTVSELNPFAWNDIFLTNPIEILENETYWFGYEVDQPVDEFPAGADSGPALYGNGDLLTLDGDTWESLSLYGLDYNWNIRAFVSENTGDSSPPDPVSALTKQYHNTGYLVEVKTSIIQQKGFKSESVAALLGYNIYRDEVKINANPVEETNYLDAGLAFGTYSYTVTALYNIGESEPAGPVEVIVEEPVQMPSGWEHAHTNTTHIIYVPTTTVFSGLPIMEEGDMIGAFFMENGTEYCAGAAEWQSNDTIKIIAFGDDLQTIQKEGFTIGEPINWKAYIQSSGESQSLLVSYHSGMPDDDGTFNDFGLSMLTSINLLPTSVDESEEALYSVYPNPGNGYFNILTKKYVSSISVYTMSGQLIYDQKVTGKEISLDLTSSKAGIYYMRMEMQNGNHLTEKIIIK